MARDILSAPASGVGTEAVFNIAGQICRPHRRFVPSTVQALMVLYHYVHRKHQREFKATENDILSQAAEEELAWVRGERHDGLGEDVARDLIEENERRRQEWHETLDKDYISDTETTRWTTKKRLDALRDRLKQDGPRHRDNALTNEYEVSFIEFATTLLANPFKCVDELNGRTVEEVYGFHDASEEEEHSTNTPSCYDSIDDENGFPVDLPG